MPSPLHEPTSPQSNQHDWGFALKLGLDTGSGASLPASCLSAPHLSKTQADTGTAALHEPGQQVQPLAGEIGFKFCHSGKKRRKEGREGRREAGSGVVPGRGSAQSPQGRVGMRSLQLQFWLQQPSPSPQNRQPPRLARNPSRLLSTLSLSPKWFPTPNSYLDPAE